MRTKAPWTIALITCLVVSGCMAETDSPENEEREWTLDRRSWNQGAFGAMSEMVDYGVKRLALSAALPPDEMDEVVEDALEIAARHNVDVFRETEFLVTDLFSSELTDGKHVLFICHEWTYQEYLELKADKQELVEAGTYEGDERTEIARRFGKLLSYPDSTITRLLAD